MRYSQPGRSPDAVCGSPAASDSAAPRVADPDPAHRLHALVTATAPLIWASAGDSIAQGARWTAGQRDDTQLLEERVRYELGRSGDVFVRMAASGRQIGDVLAALDLLDRLAPDIVLIGVGINDAKLASPTHHEDFCETYQATINHLHAHGALVIVQLPNTVQQNADATLRRSLPDYVGSMREIGQRCGALVVDHFRVWSGVGRFAHDEWMADSLHPNGRGHRVLARTLFEACGLWDETSECCRLTAVEF